NDALLSYPKTTSPAGLLWFYPSFATAKPPAGTFGNCPAQGPVIGPGYADVDLGLQKNFPFTETKKLQFRADFLNTFNPPQLRPSQHGDGAHNRHPGCASDPDGLEVLFLTRLSSN